MRAGVRWSGKSAPDTGAVSYGWLGGKERATDEATGLILMGVRLYNPNTGLFTSTDPVPGGNTTAYAYPQDPINDFDLSGKWKINWRKIGKIAVIAAGVAGAIACGVSVVCAVAVGAAAGAAAYAVSNAGTKRFKWSGLAKATAIGALSGAVRFGTGGVAGKLLYKSARTGRSSQLFGRAYKGVGSKGRLNSGEKRTGWGWNDRAKAEVFRVSWSKPGNRTRFNHIDLAWRRG